MEKVIITERIIGNGEKRTPAQFIRDNNIEKTERNICADAVYAVYCNRSGCCRKGDNYFIANTVKVAAGSIGN